MDTQRSIPRAKIRTVFKKLNPKSQEETRKNPAHPDKMSAYDLLIANLKERRSAKKTTSMNAQIVSGLSGGRSVRKRQINTHKIPGRIRG